MGVTSSRPFFSNRDDSALRPLNLGDDDDNRRDVGDSSSQSPASSSSSSSARKRRARKRKRGRGSRSEDSSSEEEEEDALEVMMRTPKKMRLRTTSRYIYETLFEQSKDFDITVEALGRDWLLHKLYLFQSPYFASMFSGGWRESGESRVKIGVVDPRITVDAFNTALGSLYQDEITVEPAKVLPILAAATMIQQEGLILQCNETMQSTINLHTVVDYYEAASEYGAVKTKQCCLQWLHVNLLSHLPEQPDRLRLIPQEIMKELISSPSLFVMQTEFSAYVLLRLYVFLRFHHNWEGNPQDAVLTSHRYFQDRAKSSSSYFLDSTDGQPFVDLFRQLRLNHLINHHMDMEMLLADRIVPDSWMNSVYRSQWQMLLRVDQGIDKGPTELSDEEFDRNCLRCGRTLNVGGQQHMWRWTGFNMGLDLIVTYDNYTLSIKRNQSSSLTNEHEALMATHKKRNVLYRVTVACLNEQKQVAYMESTGIQSASLCKNTSQLAMKMKPDQVKFPILLSFNFYVASPINSLSETDDISIEDVQ